LPFKDLLMNGHNVRASQSSILGRFALITMGPVVSGQSSWICPVRLASGSRKCREPTSGTATVRRCEKLIRALPDAHHCRFYGGRRGRPLQLHPSRLAGCQTWQGAWCETRSVVEPRRASRMPWCPAVGMATRSASISAAVWRIVSTTFPCRTATFTEIAGR
jgi:hypothetical protein